MIPRLLLVFTLMALTPFAAAGERERTALQKINQGALVIDVRTPAEYVGGHLQESILIPHQQIVEKIQRLRVEKDREIVLYCRSGNRAGIAETALRQQGYTNLFNGGGFSMLKQERLSGT